MFAGLRAWWANALSGALAGATLVTQFPAGNPLASQLQTVARIVKVRGALGLSRQVFFCELNGFDTHGGQLPIQDTLLQQFGRTLTPNGSALRSAERMTPIIAVH